MQKENELLPVGNFEFFNPPKIPVNLRFGMVLVVLDMTYKAYKRKKTSQHKSTALFHKLQKCLHFSDMGRAGKFLLNCLILIYMIPQWAFFLWFIDKVHCVFKNCFVSFL